MSRFNEWYPNGPMVAPGAISMTKVKNALKKANSGYSVENCHNSRVNGQLRGCFGFVHKSGSDRIVYFDTESCGITPQILVRYAKSDKDYCGETNNYCSFDGFVEKLDEMFRERRL